jgi:uncharacterized protein
MSESIGNRAERVSRLKGMIRHLHQGGTPEAVKSQLRQMVRETDATEIMDMEQELISGGMPVEEVRSMCDLHSQVTRDVLVQLPVQPIQPGHPLDTFRRENQALQQVIDKLRLAISALEENEGHADCAAELNNLRQGANELMDVDKHYQRKEHALFSLLERHGITGPSKVMWAKDDEVRLLLKRFNQAARDCPAVASECKAISEAFALPAITAVQEMIFKEEHILLPLSQQTLTEDQWEEVWAASPKYGWCLVEPREGYRPPENRATEGTGANGTITLPGGNITVKQLASVFSTLPLDLTFVDADDRVAFFTEGPQRIFARSKAVIGRKVQHCHPPKSVDMVNRILDDFRAGRQNVAEFWLNFHSKFVHVRYFAVRDEEGHYLGTLEVTQDIAPLRELQGERRLLEYDEPIMVEA